MLQLYKVPDYVHGGNVPVSHYERVYKGPPGDDLEKVPDHLADPRWVESLVTPVDLPLVTPSNP